MERMSAFSVWMINLMTLAVFFGTSYGIRSCGESSHTEKIQAHARVEAERKEELRFYRVAAGLEEGPETSYFATVNELLTMPVIKEKLKDAKLSTIVDLARRFDQTSENVLVFLSAYYVDTSGTTTALELLTKLKNHEAHGTVVRHSNDDLDQILMREQGVPEYLEKASDPPEAFMFWQPIWWLVVWSITGAVFIIALFVIYFLIPDRERDRKNIFTEFPWWTFGGLFSVLTSAPVYVVAGVMYLIYRVALTEWGPAVRHGWGTVRRTAYRFRIIRRLPPLEVEEARLQDPGALEVVIAAGTDAPIAEMTHVAGIEQRERPDGVQWFAFRRGLIRGHHRELEQADIKPVMITLTHPSEIRVFALPASSMDAFERIARLMGSAVEYAETDIRSMYLCTYRRESGRVEVTCKDEHSERVEKMMMQLSADFGGIDIIFDSSHDTVPDPELRGTGVVVYHCTRPSASEQGLWVKVVYGRRFKGEGNKLIAPAEGRGKIIHDEHGNAVAQVIGRNIFTLVYKMLAAKADWADEALSNVIAVGITTILSKEADGDQEALNDVWRENLDDHRKSYIRMALEKFRLEERQIECDIDDCDENVGKARKALTSGLRQKKDFQARLSNLRDGPLRLRQEELVKEFDQLAASPYVVGVKCQDGFIDIYTGPIFIDHDEARYEIGRFRLRLNDAGHIGITNVDNTSDSADWHHPHIPSRSGPCFGNLNESLGKYLADRQFAVVVSLLYRFLEQYNPHRGVEDIRHWKEVHNA